MLRMTQSTVATAQVMDAILLYITSTTRASVWRTEREAETKVQENTDNVIIYSQANRRQWQRVEPGKSTHKSTHSTTCGVNQETYISKHLTYIMLYIYSFYMVTFFLNEQNILH